MATNFKARDGDKLAYCALIFCAGILQRMGISQRRLLLINIDDDSSTSGRNFVNFGPVTPGVFWSFVWWVGACTHGQKTHFSDVFTRVAGLIFVKRLGNLEG